MSLVKIGAQRYTPEVSKSYATEANAEKAFLAKFRDTPLRYEIRVCNDESQPKHFNRFYVVAYGMKAFEAGVHWHGFNIIAF